MGLIFNLVSYWAIGFRPTAEAFFILCLGLLSFSINWLWIAQWFVAVFPNIRIAQIIGGIHISLTFLFAGVFIPVVEIPAGWKGFYYVVSSSHALRLIALPQFYCEGGVAAGCKQISAVINGQPTMIDQYEFVKDKRLGIDYDHRWEPLGWIICIGIIFRILTVLAYRFINHVKR